MQIVNYKKMEGILHALRDQVQFYLFIYSFIYLFIYLSVYSFIYLFILFIFQVPREDTTSQNEVSRVKLRSFDPNLREKRYLIVVVMMIIFYFFSLFIFLSYHRKLQMTKRIKTKIFLLVLRLFVKSLEHSKLHCFGRTSDRGSCSGKVRHKISRNILLLFTSFYFYLGKITVECIHHIFHPLSPSLTLTLVDPLSLFHALFNTLSLSPSLTLCHPFDPL